MKPISKTFLIENKLGLHARAAAKFVKLASQFSSDITISTKNQSVNGKSIMGILMLAAAKGTKITLHIEGKDASEAMQEIEQLIVGKFGEE